MAARLDPGSVHQLRSKSRIARSRSESAIHGSLPILPARIKHFAPGAEKAPGPATTTGPTGACGTGTGPPGGAGTCPPPGRKATRKPSESDVIPTAAYTVPLATLAPPQLSTGLAPVWPPATIGNCSTGVPVAAS